MPELIIALDTPDASSALSLVDRLRSHVTWFKVGLGLFVSEGPGIIESLRTRGCKVFLDLKFLDIPHQVANAVTSAAQLGANMVTLHLLGGKNMVEAAVDARNRCASQGPLLFGVTILTSMEASDFPGLALSDTGQTTQELALNGYSWGVDGVVCSGLEVSSIKTSCASSFFCLTPGIRMHRSGDDQKRIVTPGEAVKAGSDFLVVGRPVTSAPDPVQAARQILSDMVL